MADSIGIAVMGASGRMGRMLIDTISESDRAHLIAVTERAGHDWIGCDLGEAWDAAGWACRSMPTRSTRS
jgi:4-hydroxy-tetrahydrodipicolinate reductase